MATRFYFLAPQTNPPGFAASTPAVHSIWNTSSALSRHRLLTSGARWNNTQTAAGPSESVTTADYDVAALQYISDPLDGAQTISGTMRGQIRASESNIAADAHLQIVVRVFSNDLATLRGTLYAGDTRTGIVDELTTTLQNQQMPAASATNATAGVATLTSVSASDGDRLVVEIGVRFGNVTSTARSVTMSIGGPTTYTDLSVAGSETTAATIPWIEFSQNLVLDAMPAVSTLVDTFDTYDTAVWKSVVGTPDLSGGGNLRLDGSPAETVQTQALYDFFNSQVVIKIGAIPFTGFNGANGFTFYVGKANGAVVGTPGIAFRINSLDSFGVTQVDLVADRNSATMATLTNYAYATNPYLRLRNDGTTNYWEYGPDGSTWTTLFSEAMTSCDINPNGVYVTMRGNVITASGDIGFWEIESVNPTVGGGTVSQSDADTATGVETTTIAATSAGTDTAAGTEGTPSIGLPSSDVAAGTEAAPSNAQTSTEAATAVDAGTVAASIPATDSASSDDLTAVSAALPSADTAAGADVDSTSADLAEDDTATGTDSTLSTASSTATETATGVEVGEVAASFTSADAAAGLDVGSTSVDFADTDSGTSTEIASLSASATTTDAGTSTDAHAIGTTSADSSTALDASAVAADVSAGDAGSGVDTATLVGPSSSDVASAVESASVGASIAGTDTTSGVDSGTVNASVADNDTGSGTDTAASGSPVTATDAAAGTEAQALSVTLSTSDTSSSTDAGAVTAEVPATETATSVETVGAFGIGAAAGDTAAGSDVASLQASVSGTEAGAGTEAASLGLAVADTATADSAADVDTNTNEKTSSDTAAASDVVSVGLSGFDAAAGTEANVVELGQNDTTNATELGILTTYASDSASGTEAEALGRSTADTGTGDDSASLGLSVVDTALLADVASLVAALSASDVSTVADVAVTVASLFVEDVGVSTEAVSLGVVDITTGDVASSVDTSDVPSAALSVADTATAVDDVRARAEGVEIGVFSSVDLVGSFATVADGDAGFSSTALDVDEGEFIASVTSGAFASATSGGRFS